MTKDEIMEALAKLTFEERRRVVGEATIQIAVRLRNEGEEPKTEYEGGMFEQ